MVECTPQVFLTKEYLAIAMEFAAGGDMFQYVKQRGGLEEVEARWFFQQLIIGMDYCHKMASAPVALTDGPLRPLVLLARAMEYQSKVRRRVVPPLLKPRH